MATIHYSLSGEGRGHAARAQVLVNLLKERHKVVVHAYGDSLQMLAPLQESGIAEVREIPGMRFAYDKNGTLNRPGSLFGALPFLAKMPLRAQHMARVLDRERVDLAIADFEPLLPRAANLAGVPVMSVDHQLFLTRYDLSELPEELKRKAAFLSPFVEPYYKKLTHSVISAFFFPPVKKAKTKVTQTGVLLRDEILNATPERGDHLVAYVRRKAPRRILQALRASKKPVHVYGHGARPPEANLTFKEIHPSLFAQDLASSTGLVTTAGNQVVGEALYLRKPVLAYPEPGNFEQHINAFFLNRSGQGVSRNVHQFSADLLQDFVETVPLFVDRMRPERLNGNRAVMEAIEGELGQLSLRQSNTNRAALAPRRATLAER